MTRSTRNKLIAAGVIAVIMVVTLGSLGGFLVVFLLGAWAFVDRPQLLDANSTDAEDPATSGTSQTGMKRNEKLVIAGGLVIYYLWGAAVALAAAIGGPILHKWTHTQALTCEYKSVASGSNDPTCSIWSTFSTMAAWIHWAGLLTLIVGAVVLVVSVALMPKLRDEFRKLR